MLTLYYSPLCTCVLGCADFPQSRPTLCDLLDYRPGSYVHRIFQARLLEWAAVYSSRRSSQSRDRSDISCVSCNWWIRNQADSLSLPWETLGNMWLEIISTVLLKIIYIHISTFSSLIKYTSVQYFVILIKKEVAQSFPTLMTPWTAAHQAPLSMGFSRQEYWNGVTFPSPRDLPKPGIEPRSPAL